MSGEEEDLCLDRTSPISRSSVTQVAYTVRKFDQVKQDLVREIGFHGILELPEIAKVDRKFTMWLLTKLNPETKCIVVNDQEVIDVIDFEVTRIMGIPCGSKCVCPLNGDDRKSRIDFIRNCIGGEEGETNGLVAAGLNVTKDYSYPMSKKEIDAFKVSFVVWVMGHLLAPTKKHNVGGDGFWGALNNPDEIKLYNWSAFVLDELFSAARDVQDELKQKKTVSCFTGCSILLQILYFDNVNMGSLNRSQGILPRIKAYDSKILTLMIAADKACSASNSDNVVWGSAVVRPHVNVTKTMHHTDKGPLNETVHGHELISDFGRFVRETFGDKMTPAQSTFISSEHDPTVSLLASHDIGDTSIQMVEQQNVLEHQNYGTQALLESAMPQWNGIESSQPTEESSIQVLEQQSVPSQIEDTSLAVVAHEIGASSATQDIAEGCPLKKIVTRHSKYPISPFEMAFGHESVPRVKKITVFHWLSNRYMPHTILNRIWFQHDQPYTISMCGYELRSCMELSGSFNIDVCDAIMRLWTHLNGKMYRYNVRFGEIHKTWRHFLPASFARSVLGQEDYLHSDKIRASFIGGHISYRVENCQMIILPVKYHDKWSCYFWDLKEKTLSVMDPCFMRSNPIKVRVHHEQVVQDLHRALIDCINHFFVGWSVDDSGWRFIYPTNLGPRCLPANSGLFAVHYARAADGQALYYDVKEPTDSNLSEARAEILYWLFVMAGNRGYLPEDLFEDLGIYI